MTSVIYVDFAEHNRVVSYSADVYSADMKKYQFQVLASSMTEAYYSFVVEYVSLNVSVVRCMAIYLGLSEQRDSLQSPEKVWQMPDRSANGASQCS
jgi:hypothetical protein